MSQLPLFAEPAAPLDVPETAAPETAAPDVPALDGLALLESLPEGLPKRRAYVYSINDPRTGQPVYFGKTAAPPRVRFGQHKRDSAYDSRPLYDWWRSVAAEGLEPVMTVLIECDSDLESRVMEAAIIGLCRLAGLPIKNSNKGGEGKAADEQGRCRTHGEYAPGRGCRECGREYARDWKADNRERTAETDRKYREANREADLARKRKYREANREKCAEYKRAYNASAKGREARRKYNARRAPLKAAQPVS